MNVRKGVKMSFIKDIIDYIDLGTLSYFDTFFIDIWMPYQIGAKAEMISMRSLLENDFSANSILMWEEQKFLDGVY